MVLQRKIRGRRRAGTRKKTAAATMPHSFPSEEKLRKSEEFHRLISEIASDYAYDCRVDADGSVHMESITDGFVRVTGYSLEEIKTRGDWVTLIHPEDLGPIQEKIPDLLSGKARVDECRIITKSGQTRWIRYSTRPIWDPVQGRVVRLLGAVQDITEHKEDQRKLQDYAQSLQALSRRLIEVQELERRHLARELHDEIGQVLTALRLSMEMSTRLEGEAFRDNLAQAQELLRELTGRVRNLSLNLRPAMLDDLGLLPALLWHVEGYSRQTNIQVTLEHQGLEGRRFRPELETGAYRIVQEALTNVARHSGAGRAAVRLRIEDGHLRLLVEDEGNGFDPAGLSAGGFSSGISGMQERAQLLEGKIELESRPGMGTRLTALLPL